MLQFFECCLASLSHTWRRLYLSARGFDQIHFDFENNKISHLKLISVDIFQVVVEKM